MFRCGRNMAAWIGLVAKQNSSGGKERLGSITKAGNRLRQMLFAGAMAVIRSSGMRIPSEASRRFRRKPAGDSDASQPPIPIHASHP